MLSRGRRFIFYCAEHGGCMYAGDGVATYRSAPSGNPQYHSSENFVLFHYTPFGISYIIANFSIFFLVKSNTEAMLGLLQPLLLRVKIY